MLLRYLAVIIQVKCLHLFYQVERESGTAKITVTTRTSSQHDVQPAMSTIRQLVERYENTLPVGVHTAKAPRLEYFVLCKYLAQFLTLCYIICIMSWLIKANWDFDYFLGHYLANNSCLCLWVLPHFVINTTQHSVLCGVDDRVPQLSQTKTDFFDYIIINLHT